MRLLVFDDERGMTAFIGTVARDRGWTVGCAATEAEFRAHFAANRPDAITLDLQLGDVDGVEQLRFLGTAGFTGSVVLISGFDQRVLASARQRGESLGLDIVAAVSKPLRLAQLRQVLGEVERHMAAKPAPGIVPAKAASVVEFTPDDVLAAIEAGQMDLFLQPVVAAPDFSIARFEALIRWRHPTAGLVPPDRFIAVAEQDRAVIDRLTFWVLETAIEQHCRLAAEGMAVPISVNVSGLNLHRLDFPDKVAALIDGSGMEPGGIAFEITESVATSDPGATSDILTRLRLKGFTLAIDDFGTGYSSLKALQELPFSELKIDKSFVAKLCDSDEALAIVRSLVRLARDLNLECVAEGVETAEIASRLADLGATGLQGYHFSRPLPFADAAAWLRSWIAEHPARRAKLPEDYQGRIA